jgi:hypothetical protein
MKKNNSKNNLKNEKKKIFILKKINAF